MAAKMPDHVLQFVGIWRPRVAWVLAAMNQSLAGRGLLLSAAFGLCLVIGLWQGGEQLPRSAWQELGLLDDRPSLRRLAPRDAADLASIFDQHDYTLAMLQDGAAVPRLAVTRLPRDLAEIAESDARKALFLRSLLPLVLQANAEIAHIRAQVMIALDARGAGRIGATDALWLQQVAQWYGADPADDADILSRIDQVPPSLVLAQAAQESGWGSSRFARDANALFGQRVWNDNAPGLAPREAKQKNFRVRAFPDLLSGVRAYLHNLNSHRAYQDLRDRRARARAVGRVPSALDLAGTLSAYSEEGSVYVAALRRLIKSNGLAALDRLRLDEISRS